MAQRTKVVIWQGMSFTRPWHLDAYPEGVLVRVIFAALIKFIVSSTQAYLYLQASGRSKRERAVAYLRARR